MRRGIAIVALAIAILARESAAFITLTSHGCNLIGPPVKHSRTCLQMQQEEGTSVDQPPALGQGQRSSFLGTKNFVPDGGDWFQKTKDASDRINNDPLSPLKSTTTVKRSSSETLTRKGGIERDSNNWYVNQEKKRSMFGRTLNPLTGELQDKDEDAEALNPLEDPIFYVILIVGAPALIMIAAAQACLVPALSLAFGFECSFE